MAVFVNRESVIQAILALQTPWDSPSYRECIEDACHAVSKLSADSDVHSVGKWETKIINSREGIGYLTRHKTVCSVCGTEADYDLNMCYLLTPFCPYCGADLRGD